MSCRFLEALTTSVSFLRPHSKSSDSSEHPPPPRPVLQGGQAYFSHDQAETEKMVAWKEVSHPHGRWRKGCGGL